MAKQSGQEAGKRNKRERVPVSGFRDIMTVDGKDPAYSYRFIEDTDELGSNIMRYQRGGWDLAESDGLVIGSEAVYRSKNSGSLVRYMTGNGKYSYLMRIRKEWYEEDQAAKAREIDRVENAIKRTGNADEDEGQYLSAASFTRDD